jgi:hypothetical protein
MLKLTSNMSHSMTSFALSSALANSGTASRNGFHGFYFIVEPVNETDHDSEPFTTLEPDTERTQEFTLQWSTDQSDALRPLPHLGKFESQLRPQSEENQVHFTQRNRSNDGVFCFR